MICKTQRKQGRKTAAYREGGEQKEEERGT